MNLSELSQVCSCPDLELRLGLPEGACNRWLRDSTYEAEYVRGCVEALLYAEQLGADMTEVMSLFFTVPQPDIGGLTMAEAIAEGRLPTILSYLTNLSAGASG